MSIRRNVVLRVAGTLILAVLSTGSLIAQTITSISPTSGTRTTQVTLTGTGFGATQGSNYVMFATTKATVQSWSTTQILCTPQNQGAGSVSVYVSVGGVQSNQVNFTLTNPVINNLSINSAPVDQEITINGNNYGTTQGTSTVTFNNITASPSSWSNTAITVPVPSGATTGNIVVTVNGVASTGYMFMVVPPAPPAGLQFMQGNWKNGLGTTSTITFPISQNARDLNVVVINWQGTNSVSSVTDSAGNTYALAVGPTVGSSETQAIYYAKDILEAGENVITLVFASAPTAAGVRIAEYSGLDLNSPLDVTAAATGTGSAQNETASSGNATTTNANDLLVGAAAVTGMGVQGPGTSYTNRVITTGNGGNILEDRIVTTAGSYAGTASLGCDDPWVMQMVAFKQAQNQAPNVDAGPNQTITLPTNTVTLDGTATDDGLPNNTLTISWTKISGPGTVTFSSPSTAASNATFSTSGVYVVQLSANDSQLTTNSTTTITVNPEPVSIVLSPGFAGPDVTSTSQALTATVKAANTGTPIANASVAFTVAGANATSGNGTTNSSGVATFSYTGTKQGSDTVQAAYSGSNSNTASIGWVTPTQPVSTTTAPAQFFVGDGGCTFDITPGTKPAFTLSVPTLAFDPPAGWIPGNNTGANNNTRPFTGLVMDVNGNVTGTIVAQGNGYQAGVGVMNAFQAVFTGTFTIASAGNLTFNIASDDGFIMGIGNGASYVSGTLYNPPPSNLTPFESLTVVAAHNNWGAGTYQNVVNFPSAGTYPYEVDYDECAGGPLSFAMTDGQTNPIGLPPSGAVLVTPTNPSAQNAGQSQTFTVAVTDASGASVSNTPVTLEVRGANQKQLSGSTDSTGHATFQYTGTNAGTDSIQAMANISSMAGLSNVVTMTWNGGSGGCSTFVFTPQGWISAPLISAVVQGQMPITLASGITLTSGTLKMFPTANPGQVTTLNSNTTGTGPITLGTIDATLLPNGEYTIQLEATNSSGSCQLSEIVVSVTGEYKPGREKVTVTDLTVPLAGMPISITRTYDSLNRATVGDFGDGWNLSTNVQLSVDQLMNVTLTVGGKAQTFYFAPRSAGQGLFPWLILPNYTPQPGLYGSLTSNGCSALIQVGGALVQDNLGVACFPAGSYSPTAYTYTDPVGRVYQIACTGSGCTSTPQVFQLQSITDTNGNTLTITPAGITSSVGQVVVPFVRDSQNRITKITDLNGNIYQYSYDSPCSTGNLCSVSFPGLTASAQYTYFPDHSLDTQVDPNGNTTTTVYYSSSNDGGNTSLDGRIYSVTGPSVPGPNGNTQYVTQYSYNLTANSITVTNPDSGTVTTVYDSFGKPLSVTDALNRKTTYSYDSKENLVQMVDALQNPAWVYGYDANGCQTSIQDPLGNKSTTVYNQFCQPTSITDAANTNTQTLTYDGNFNLKQVVDLENGPNTSVMSSTYDALGNVLTSTDANGQTTQYEYDPRGNLIQITDPLNEVTHLGYDPMDRLVSQTDPRGNTTQFQYYPLGWLKTKTDALGNATNYTYDNNGNKLTEKNANNNTTSYQYDALNRVTKITYPDNTTRQFTYDFRNNKLTEIDQAGHETFYVYDTAGELQSVTYGYNSADAGTVQYTYDLDGKTKTVKDELGNITTNNYDPAERLTSVQDATTNPPTVYGYDPDNRITSVQDPNGNTVTYSYYPRNWMKSIAYPATSTQPITTMQYAYDGMGRVLTTTDQASQVTTDVYDGVGRLKSVTDAQNQKTQYFYDAASNLQFVEDALGRFTSYQYDPLNRLALRILPLSMAESRTYDPVGNLHTKQDFNGKTTTYAYDTLNRIQQRIPDSSLHQTTVSFTYTPTGKRLSMVDASGTTSYTAYDNRDRLKTKATPEGTLNYTYDAHGNVLTIASSNTNGASMQYTYDVLNRLATAKDLRMAALGGPSTAASYGYDPAGNLTRVGYPNTIQAGNTFDTLNRLTQTCVATSAPACSASQKLASFAYTLGYAGNRTGVTELSGRNVAYAYDNDYRLKSETIASDQAGNNGAESYTYDNVGNRLTLNSTIPSLSGANSYSYDSNDRLSTDTYDANGNTTSSAGITNTYDFENHLLKHGSTVTLIYDGDGNRVSETVGSTTTKYLIDDLNPTGYAQILDELTSGSVNRFYAYGLQRISEDQLVGSTWTPSFYGYDGHGNVRFLANSAGAQTDSYTLDAFGMLIASTGTTANNFRYSGEWLDPNLSFYNLRARYYNALTGRFESMDTDPGDISDPETLHKYVFTGENPINFVDPTGHADVGEYESLVVRFRGTGLQAHHIIPQRFAQTLGAAYCTIAVELTPGYHLVLTNLWRAVLPYGGVYTPAQIFAAAEEVYWGFPQMAEAAQACATLAGL